MKKQNKASSEEKRKLKELTRDIFIRNKIKEVLLFLAIVGIIVCAVFYLQSVLNANSSLNDRACHFLMGTLGDCSNFVFNFGWTILFVFGLFVISAILLVICVIASIPLCLLFSYWINCNKEKAEREARKIMNQDKEFSQINKMKRNN